MSDRTTIAPPAPAAASAISTGSSIQLPALKLEAAALSPAEYRFLKAAQTTERKNLPPKTVSGIGKNISWKGEALFCLAVLVDEALKTGKDITAEPVRIAVYEALNRAGFKASAGQVEAALRGIFGCCADSADVYSAFEQHRSYGDWLKELTPQQRKALRQRRFEAFAEKIKTLAPEEIKERKKRVRDAILETARSAPGQEGVAVAAQFEAALGASANAKYIEKSRLPGALHSYGGVPEKMRSSWEALYANIVGTLKGKRFYFYEPMGFPLLIPGAGKIKAYHPDFFELRANGSARVVEIKGALTKTSQEKLRLFQKYYLEEDLSGLSETEQKIFRPLLEKAKEQARKQFSVYLGPKTRICVMGALPWDAAETNFCIKQRRARQGAETKIEGLIPRMMRRFSHLAPQEQGRILSDSEMKSYFKKAAAAEGRLEVVAPLVFKDSGGDFHGTLKKERPNELYLDAQVSTQLYCAAYITAEITSREVKRAGIECSAQDLIRSMASYLHFAEAGHGWTDRYLKEFLAERNRGVAAKFTAGQKGHAVLDFLAIYCVGRTLEGLSKGGKLQFYEYLPTYESTLKTRVDNLDRLMDFLPAKERLDQVIDGAPELSGRELSKALESAQVAIARVFSTACDLQTLGLDAPYVHEQMLPLIDSGNFTGLDFLKIKPMRA